MLRRVPYQFERLLGNMFFYLIILIGRCHHIVFFGTAKEQNNQVSDATA